ncbi:MAG: NAD(P)/FAD-dependent oxidoreductase [Sterolibacterium sp.]
MEKIDSVVIGAGVIGLAVARCLAQAGREVLLLEAAETFGNGISSRNSEVIHAGLHYPVDSLKTRLCVQGREMLYAYCVERGVAHRRCGKLIVATHAGQLGQLDEMAAHARNADVNDLERLSMSEAKRLEPALSCLAALYSPSTGIVDSHALMLALLGDAERAGAILAVKSPVLGGEVTATGILLEIGGSEPAQLLANSVFLCAGLGAQPLARALRGLPPQSVPPLSYAKGNYFALAGRAPFSHLIYPLPEAAGLGVHLTLDLAGQARFGPDVEWVEHLDNQVDPRRAESFYAAIRSYWPALPQAALVPAYAGIRPKPHTPGAAACDFMIQGKAQHGVTGLVCCYGIESPGLTSALALADYAVTLGAGG